MPCHGIYGKQSLTMINRERLVKTFQEMVSIDAESYHERKMADYVAGKLKELGLQVSEDDSAGKILENNGVNSTDAAGNLYAVLPATGPGNPVLFGCHLDTVSPGNGKQAILHEDGTITSAGTTVLGADDVSAIAEILEALTVIQENKVPHPEIEVIAAAAEEPYAQGSRVFDYSKVHAKLAYVFDMSGPVGPAAIAAPSIISFQVEVRGKTAHAGFAPEAGIHAIQIAAEALSRIPNGHVGKDTTVNIGTIQGGIAQNIVPDHVVLTGEIRSLDDEVAREQLEQIRLEFEHAANRLGGEAKVSSLQQFKAYRISEDEEVTKRYRKAGELAGISTSFVETFGGSDNNHYTENGIRGIVAACAMNKSHTTEEYTTVDELERAAKMVYYLAAL